MDDRPDRDLLPEGLQDRLPPAAAVTERVRRGILDVLDSYGYDRVQPPLIEFEKSMASRMDGVQPRRMVRFIDPASLRTLALRSDMTVQVGRISATSLGTAPRPLRLCYAGHVALIKGDGLDPSRERLQLGAELIGSDAVEAAAEIVMVAIEALQAVGAKGVSVDFTLPDLVDTLCRDALPLPDGGVAKVRRELDAKNAGGLAEAGGEAYLPLLYAIGPFEQSLAELRQLNVSGALDSRIAGLSAIAECVCGKARLTLDPTERHGFEYQSWFGFTIYAEGVSGALGRGGTYRILGRDEPATGFSLYPDPLIDIATKAEPCRDMLFLPLGHDEGVAARLRAIGWRTRAAIGPHCNAKSLGCTHELHGEDIKPL